jgi:hypothetical protein
VPRGVYPRVTGKKNPLDVSALLPDSRRKRGKRWSKARRAALAEKMRKSHGRGRLSPTLEAAVLVSKANDLVLREIVAGAKPTTLQLLILQAHLVLSAVDE